MARLPPPPDPELLSLLKAAAIAVRDSRELIDRINALNDAEAAKRLIERSIKYLDAAAMMLQTSRTASQIMFATHIEQAHQHVALGESLVAEQKALIERLRAGGHPTDGPERVLATLEETLTLMHEHLAFERSHRP